MTDVNQEVVEEQDTIDYKAMYEEAQKSIQALASKKDELLKETKAAKDAKRRQDEVAENAQKEQLVIAEKNGEFEKLFKAERERATQLEELLGNTKKEQRNEKINIAAMRVASDLAKGDAYKAELLSEFLAKTISKVADEKGQIDEDTLKSVRKQFEQDKKYAPLLGGNLSSGGSAPGNTRSAQTSNIKEVTMSDYEKMTPTNKLEFSKLVQSGKATLI